MFKNAGRVKRTIEEYFVLTVATLILVVGVYVFKFPNNFSFGGVTGIADVSWVKCSGEMVPNVCATHLTAGAGTDLCDRASGGEFSHLI